MRSRRRSWSKCALNPYGSLMRSTRMVGMWMLRPYFQLQRQRAFECAMGKRLITDGPFAETREQLGGYFLINANDLDEALAVAARVPGGRIGTVEVRPVMHLEGLPKIAL